jgi:hypothetical protein
VRPNSDDQVDVTVIMRALDQEVVDVVWQAVEPLLPPRPRFIRWAVTGPVCRTGSGGT